MTRGYPPAAFFVKLAREHPGKGWRELASMAALDERTAEMIAAQLQGNGSKVNRVDLLKSWAADETLTPRTRQHLARAAEQIEAGRERRELQALIAQKRKELQVLRDRLAKT